MPPKATTAEPRAKMTRVNYSRDPETCRVLNRIVAEVPDITTHSAAIRYLARTWEESRSRRRAP